MIRVRLVAETAGDVDELHAVAEALGSALRTIRISREVPRRRGDGVSLYLDVEPPAAARGTVRPGSR